MKGLWWCILIVIVIFWCQAVNSRLDRLERIVTHFVFSR